MRGLSLQLASLQITSSWVRVLICRSVGYGQAGEMVPGQLHEVQKDQVLSLRLWLQQPQAVLQTGDRVSEKWSSTKGPRGAGQQQLDTSQRVAR